MGMRREPLAPMPDYRNVSAWRKPTAAAAQEPARLTLRISAEKARQLREVARERGVSVNTLLDEMASLAVFEFELMRSLRHD